MVNINDLRNVDSSEILLLMTNLNTYFDNLDRMMDEQVKGSPQYLALVKEYSSWSVYYKKLEEEMIKRGHHKEALVKPSNNSILFGLDMFDGKEWVSLVENSSLEEINRTLYVLTSISPGLTLRVLEGLNVQCFLDGSEYQYNWWKEKFLEESKEKTKKYERGGK